MIDKIKYWALFNSELVELILYGISISVSALILYVIW